jgi:hypothetical protein
MVVGGGHSALNALIELADLRDEVPSTSIVWIMRKADIETAYGGEEADALQARGALGSQARRLVEAGIVHVVSPYRIAAIEAGPEGKLKVSGDHAGSERRIAVDEMIVATGFRPDFSFLSEMRLTVDPWLESSGEIGPLIDPNLHSCGTVRPHGAKELAHVEPGFFIAGMKSYGRAPTFLLATGHEQVRSIVAALLGDIEAAARVELLLPETGVCTTRPIRSKALGDAATPPEAGSCCGASAKEEPAPLASSCFGPKPEALVALASKSSAGGRCGPKADAAAPVVAAAPTPAEGGCCGSRA